jgi:hypothetical protein
MPFDAWWVTRASVLHASFYLVLKEATTLAPPAVYIVFYLGHKSPFFPTKIVLLSNRCTAWIAAQIVGDAPGCLYTSHF